MNTSTNLEPEEDSIDLIAIAKTLWNGRKTILISTAIFSVLGIVVALTTPNQYTATTVMVPQMSKSGASSSLSSLASLAGFDMSSLNQSSSDLSPLIYPQIINSIPFMLELMNTPVHFAKMDSAVSVYDYYVKYRKVTFLDQVKRYTIGLPGVLIGLIRGKEKETVRSKSMMKLPLSMTKKQAIIKKMLDKQVQLAVEKKDGYITLTSTMSEPLVAAELAEKAQQMLQAFIIKYKVEKSQAELDFIQERFNIAKAQAEGYQYNVAATTDKYKDLVSNVPQVNTSRLQTKYSIANSVYMELAKQLEQAKIQVKKDTPTFTIVEPVSIPTEKSGSSRAMTIVVFVFLGAIIGGMLIYSKIWLSTFKQKWAQL